MKLPHVSVPPAGAERRTFFLRILLTILVMCAPLLVALLLTLPRGYSIFSALPRWSDETWWYAQYAAFSKYWRPLGYFGYMGTHADIGTFGPWGMFPLVLTGFLSRIFGWGLHAFVYYNFFYLALSSLIFVLLTKPSTRGLICLAITNALAFIAICYSAICMNEVVRYSMALVLTGIMHRLITCPDCTRIRRILRYTLVPLLLVYASAFYLILSVFIPVYLFLMLRRCKPVWRILITVVVSAAAIYLIRDLNAATACPYILSSSTHARSVPLPLSMKIQNFYYGLLANLTYVDPFYLMLHAADDSELQVHLWLCLSMYVLIGALVLRISSNAGHAERRAQLQANLMGLFLLLAFLGGHIVLYDTDGWTFVRGCYTALYCVMMLCAVAPKENAQPWRASIALCFAGVFTFITVFTTTFTTYDRFSTAEQDARWDAERQALEEVIVLDRHADDPWENTVVLCGTDDDIYYILPYGVGVNGAVDDVLNENAKYVIVGHAYSEEETRNARLRVLTDEGHEIIYETEKYTVLVNAAKFG